MHSRLWLIRFWFRNRHLPIRLPPDRLLWQNRHQSLGFSAEHLKLIPIWEFGSPESVWVAGGGCWRGRPRCTTKSDLLTNKEPDQTSLINLLAVNPKPGCFGHCKPEKLLFGRFTTDKGLRIVTWMDDQRKYAKTSSVHLSSARVQSFLRTTSFKAFQL